MISITKEVLEKVKAHAEESFPLECCGVIIATGAGEVARRITNVQDRLHAEDPKNYPRTAANAYNMDGKELLNLLREVDSNGWRIKAFYHSHPDSDAYFSPEDARRALLWGEPAYPDAHYLVAAVYGGKMTDIRGYTWDGERGEFVCQEVVGT